MVESASNVPGAASIECTSAGPRGAPPPQLIGGFVDDAVPGCLGRGEKLVPLELLHAREDGTAARCERGANNGEQVLVEGAENVGEQELDRPEQGGQNRGVAGQEANPRSDAVTLRIVACNRLRLRVEIDTGRSRRAERRRGDGQDAAGAA